MTNMPKPQFSWTQAMSAALTLSLRAVDEVRALARTVSQHAGTPGPAGPPGKLTKAKPWVEEQITYENQVVTYFGSTYQALRDTARVPSDPADWICLAEAGHNGEDGRGLNVKDTYDPKEKYKRNDVVTQNYTWFVARKDDPGACPGPDWKSGPGPGKVGRPGERGPAGARGEQGSPGKEVVAWKYDVPNYRATPIMSDGSECVPIDLRPFFNQYDSEKH